MIHAQMTRATSRTTAALAAVAIGASALVTTGCSLFRSDREYSATPAAMELGIRPSANKVYVGETVTVFSRTENTLGKPAEIRWNSTGGNVQVEESGRVARVTFDRPGTYSVDAALIVDGEEVKRQSAVVEVAALP